MVHLKHSYINNLIFLKKKEIKSIFELVKTQFGASLNMDYNFLKNKKGKIYIIRKEISKIDLSRLRINSIGMYFAEIKNNEIRLSIEGSQIVGPKANRNVLELNEKEAKEWLAGEDLFIKEKENFNGFVITKYKKDFLGCGRYRNRKVINFVGKGRRIISQN